MSLSSYGIAVLKNIIYKGSKRVRVEEDTIQIIPVKNEEDYQLLLSVESLICKETPERWHLHFGGIGVDRYFFGDKNDGIYEYGKLIYLKNQPIGYALVYQEDGEYNVWLLSEWIEQIEEIVPQIEKMFKKGQSISTVCNDNLVRKQLLALGYVSEGEVTYSAAIDLNHYLPEEVQWDLEEIRIIRNEDIDERVKYSSIPTGATITKDRYEKYMNTVDSKHVLDYVVVDKAAGNLMGYYSWWLDKSSNTAMLNPVACISKYRRRGISRRAIQYGFGILKERGFQYVYVDTSADNKAAIGLYSSVGFKKCIDVTRYSKEII